MEVLAQVLFLMFFMNCWNFNKAYTPSGYLGCYIDKINRILSHRMPNSALNSGDQCKKQCKTSGYRYAGTEYTVECFCGNVIKEYPKGSECTAKCPGNKDEICGGTWHISLYDTQESEPEDSESSEVYVPSGYLGCYIDKVERILSHRMPNFANNTGDQCKKKCKAAGYKYAGTEYTDQCFCGNNIKDYPKGSECTAKCPGNKDEICGGTWHISLYDTQEIESEDSESSEVYVPSGYLGCYIDKVERILSHRMPNFANNTGDQCKQRCEAAGYRYAGTEYTDQCFCGNNITDYPKGSECTAKCPGNKDEMCGGTWHISLYDTQEIESEDSESSEVYVPSGYLGCYIDKVERILSHRMPNSANNTGDQCKQKCEAAGYRYAGTEYTVECFCGNDIKKYPKGSECTAKCPGNKDEMCGGTWHISLYDTKENDEPEDSDSREGDLNYCEKYDACPPKWKCRNRKRGFLCRAPLTEVKISK